jgi:hypothetical protein
LLEKAYAKAHGVGLATRIAIANADEHRTMLRSKAVSPVKDSKI